MTSRKRYGFALVVVVLVGSCGVDEREQVCPVLTTVELDLAIAAQPTVDPTADPSDVEWPQTRPLLVVVTAIPAGMTVQDLVADPVAHLSARLGPDGSECATTIESVAALQSLNGSETAVVVEAGQVLDTRQFQPSGG